MRRGWYAFWSVLLGVFLVVGSVFAVGEVSHPAEQIKPGVFGGDFGGGNFSFNGSVGIRTSSPLYALDVNGSVRVQGDNLLVGGMYGGWEYFPFLGGFVGGFDEYSYPLSLFGAFNALTFLIDRGGEVSFSSSPLIGYANSLFDGTPSRVTWNVSATSFPLTIVVNWSGVMPGLNYARMVWVASSPFYQFARNFSVEVWDEDAGGWVVLDNVSGWDRGVWALSLNTSSGYNIDALRVTVYEPMRSDYFSVSEIGVWTAGAQPDGFGGVLTMPFPQYLSVKGGRLFGSLYVNPSIVYSLSSTGSPGFLEVRRRGDTDFVGLAMIDRDGSSGTVDDGDALLYWGDNDNDALRISQILWNGSASVRRDVMFLSGGGLVGVNTSSPQYTLDVNGSLHVGDVGGDVSAVSFVRSDDVHVRVFTTNLSGVAAIDFLTNVSDPGVVSSVRTGLLSGVRGWQVGVHNVNNPGGEYFYISRWNGSVWDSAFVLKDGVVSFGVNVVPSVNASFSLGSPDLMWKDLYVSNGSIYLGGRRLSVDASGRLVFDGKFVQTSSSPGGSSSSGWNDTGSVVRLVSSSDSVDAGVLFVDNVNGRVGVGTMSPSHTLDVGSGVVGVGYLYPNLGTGDPYRYVRFGDAGTYWAGFMWNNNSGVYGDGDDFTIFTYNNRDIVLQPFLGDVLLLGSGSVGIGTTSPGYKLTVDGDVGVGNGNRFVMNSIFNVQSPPRAGNSYVRGVVGTFYWDETDTSWHLYNTAGGDASGVLFDNGGTIRLVTKTGLSLPTNVSDATLKSWTRMVVTPSGNVGIGTTSPVEKLQVAGSVNVDNRVFVRDGSGWSGSPVVSLAIGDSDTGFKWVSDGVLAWYSNNGEVLRVTPSGVGIGTTSPSDKLSVSGGSMSVEKSADGLLYLARRSGQSWYWGWGLWGSSGDGSRLEYALWNGSSWSWARFTIGKNSVGVLTYPGDSALEVGGRVDASSFRDRDNTAYFVDPAGSVSALFAGKVGVGTTSPSSRVEVWSSGGSLGGVLLKSSGLNTPTVEFVPGVNTPDAGMILFGDGTGWKFHVAKRSDGGATRFLTITDSGKVGIGTDNPSYPFIVKGSEGKKYYVDTGTDFIVRPPGVSQCVCDVSYSTLDCGSLFETTDPVGTTCYDTYADPTTRYRNYTVYYSPPSDVFVSSEGVLYIGNSSSSFPSGYRMYIDSRDFESSNALSSTTGGISIYSRGIATYASSSAGYGVYGHTSSSSGYGVYCDSAGYCGGTKSWTTTSDVRVKEGLRVLIPVNSSVLAVSSNSPSLGGLLSGLAVGVPVGGSVSGGIVSGGSSVVGNVSVKQVDVLSKVRKVRPLVYRKDVLKLRELKLLNSLFVRARENASLRRILEEKGVWENLVKHKREMWDPEWARVLLEDDETVALLNASGVLPEPEFEDLVERVRHPERSLRGEVDVEVGFAAQDLKDVFPEVVVWDNATGTYGITYSELIPYLFLAIQELDAKVSSRSGSQSVLGGNVSFALRAENATRAAVADFAKNASYAFEADTARNAERLSGYHLEDITSLIQYGLDEKGVFQHCIVNNTLFIFEQNRTGLHIRMNTSLQTITNVTKASVDCQSQTLLIRYANMTEHLLPFASLINLTR